jgi:hypothetical protein
LLKPSERDADRACAEPSRPILDEYINYATCTAIIRGYDTAFHRKKDVYCNQTKAPSNRTDQIKTPQKKTEIPVSR